MEGNLARKRGPSLQDHARCTIMDPEDLPSCLYDARLLALNQAGQSACCKTDASCPLPRLPLAKQRSQGAKAAGHPGPTNVIGLVKKQTVSSLGWSHTEPLTTAENHCYCKPASTRLRRELYESYNTVTFRPRERRTGREDQPRSPPESNL
jgi:hypothetical protein